MKEEIIEIAHKLQNGEMDISDAISQMQSLLETNDGFISVSEQKPPRGVVVLAKSPSGDLHLCHWRWAYNIFDVQTKGEDSFNWCWKLV